MFFPQTFFMCRSIFIINSAPSQKKQPRDRLLKSSRMHMQTPRSSPREAHGVGGCVQQR